MTVLVFTISMWALCCLIAAMTARNYCKRIDELLSTVEEIEADRDRLSEENRKLDFVSKELKQGLINQMERCRSLEEMIAPLEASKKQLEESEAKLKAELEKNMAYWGDQNYKLRLDNERLEINNREDFKRIERLKTKTLEIGSNLDESKKKNEELDKEVNNLKELLRLKEEQILEKPLVNLDNLRAVLVPLAVKADEDAELINKLVELLRPKFKSDVLVNPEFYSQHGRVASGAPGKTTYLQWLSLILADQSNPEPDNGVEDDEF